MIYLKSFYQISEALGVPKNIYEVASDIYQKFFSEVSNKYFNHYLDKYFIPIPGTFKYGENFELENLKFVINFQREDISEPELVGVSIALGTELSADLKLKSISNEKRIKLLIYIPKNYQFRDFPNFISKIKNKLTTSISHELKHFYDFSKKPQEGYIVGTQYFPVSLEVFGIDPLDQFLYSMYFTHAWENLVRPTEFYTHLMVNNVEKKDFLEELKKYHVYQKLKKIQQFSVDNLRLELKSNIADVRKFLDDLKSKGGIKIQIKSDDETVEEILAFVYLNISKWTIQQFEDVIGQIQNPTQDQKKRIDEVFHQFKKQVKRFSSYKEFFSHYERLFHKVSSEGIKKISKLYATTK